MPLRHIPCPLTLLLLLLLGLCAEGRVPQTSPGGATRKEPPVHPTIKSELAVAQVPADFPVGFCLLTAGDYQYVAYYDVQHHMTVASRRLSEQAWQYTRLPSVVGVDSHNYVTMAVDAAGYLHVSGNMHCVPLIYFRSARPWDATSLQAVPAMTGQDEARCTYPCFLRGPNDAFLFHYRIGGSGNGEEIYNVYDLATQRWSRLLDTPLTDGGGRMNAYMDGPVLGPDGAFHLCWVWRDDPDCDTNHDLSYARSRDLVHWESAAGTPVTLPLTITTPGLIVDPIPVKGGIVNGCQRLGFDAAGRVMITYHKFDAGGNTQAYAARWEQGQWQLRQLSEWAYRWYFSGRGTIAPEITLGRIARAGDGLLALDYRHKQYGAGVFFLDAETLAPRGVGKAPARYPASLIAPSATFPGMQVKWTSDSGRSPEPGTRFVLRWETLPANNDKPRTGEVPEPSRLVVYQVRERR
jgi:hypothetical protein